MKIIGKKEVYKGKFIKVIKKKFLTKEGKEGIWECVERKIYKRAVIVFALTKKKEVILEKIYRVPLENYILELPAGLTDKRGESEKKVARRELLEETGYLAKKLTPVFSGPVHSSLAKYQAIFFFAPKVEFIGKKENEEGEEIEVIKIPLKKLIDFLVNPPKNIKVDIKVLGILPILKKKKLI